MRRIRRRRRRRRRSRRRRRRMRMRRRRSRKRRSRKRRSRKRTSRRSRKRRRRRRRRRRWFASALSPRAKSICFLLGGGQNCQNTEINTAIDIRQSIRQKNVLVRITRLALVRLKHNMGSNRAIGVRSVET